MTEKELCDLTYTKQKLIYDTYFAAAEEFCKDMSIDPFEVLRDNRDYRYRIVDIANEMRRLDLMQAAIKKAKKK